MAYYHYTYNPYAGGGAQPVLYEPTPIYSTYEPQGHGRRSYDRGHVGLGYLRTPSPPPPPPSYAEREIQENEHVRSINEFYLFYWTCMELNNKLVRCSTMFIPVGSCAPVIISVSSTIKHLGVVRDLFGKNTRALFPDHAEDLSIFRSRGPRATPDLTRLACAMLDLSQDFLSMNKAFRDYRSLFCDEKLILLFIKAHQLLKDEAMYIHEKSDHAPAHSVQAHVHGLSHDLQSTFFAINTTLGIFLNEGIPIITSAQQSRTDRYLTMTQISTFLSGVTATMLQMSYQSDAITSGVATNTFLFASLVFSLTSAVSSLLAMAWQRSVVRRPDKYLPWAVTTYLMKWPLLSLFASGILFSGALCSFAVSSSQNKITLAITIILSAMNAAGVAFLACWLIYEKWRVAHFYGHPGQSLTRFSLSLRLFGWLIVLLRVLFLGRVNADIPHDGDSDVEAAAGMGHFEDVSDLPFVTSSPLHPGGYGGEAVFNMPGGSAFRNASPLWRIRQQLLGRGEHSVY